MYEGELADTAVVLPAVGVLWVAGLDMLVTAVVLTVVAAVILVRHTYSRSA